MKRNIPLGLCSGVVAALVWIGSCGGIAVVLLNQLFFFKHPTGLRILELGVQLAWEWRCSAWVWQSGV